MIPSSSQRMADMHAKGLWPDLTFDQVLRRIVADSPDREAIVDVLASQLFANGLRKGWVGFVAPANVPGVIVDRLGVAFAQASKAPEIRERLRIMGYTPDGRSSKDFAKVIQAQTTDYTELIKSGAIQLK